MVMILSKSTSHSKINQVLFVLEKIHLLLKASLFSEVEVHQKTNALL